MTTIPADLGPYQAAVGARPVPASVYCTVGTSTIHSGDPFDRLYTRAETHGRAWNPCRGVLFLNGFGGWVPAMSPAAEEAAAGVGFRTLYRAALEVLSCRAGQDDGYTFLGVPGADATGWGNDGSMTRIGEAITAFQGTGKAGGAKAGRVALIGVSMGHCNAFNYAVRHPEQVAGVLGINPIADLVVAYNGGVDTLFDVPPGPGFPSFINDAYGIAHPPNPATLDATVKAQRDPVTRAAETAGIPWGISHQSNDTVIPASAVEGFIDARGADLVYYAQGTAPDVLTAHQTFTIDGAGLLAFLDQCHW